MKYITIILLFAAGYFYSQSDLVKEVPKSNFKQVMKTFDSHGASKDAVIGGANDLANFLCSDINFQTTGGSNVESCIAKYESSKERCEHSVFELAPITFDDRSEVSDYIKRFVTCVGIS